MGVFLALNKRLLTCFNYLNAFKHLAPHIYMRPGAIGPARPLSDGLCLLVDSPLDTLAQWGVSHDFALNVTGFATVCLPIVYHNR